MYRKSQDGREGCPRCLREERLVMAEVPGSVKIGDEVTIDAERLGPYQVRDIFPDGVLLLSHEMNPHNYFQKVTTEVTKIPPWTPPVGYGKYRSCLCTMRESCDSCDPPTGWE